MLYVLPFFLSIISSTYSTILHDAVKSGNIEKTVQLLRNGTNHNQLDSDGKKALEYASPELLTQIRHAYQRYPAQHTNKHFSTKQFSLTDYQLQQLHKKGIIKIPHFLSKQDLAQLHGDFEKFVNTVTKNNLTKTVGFTSSSGNKSKLAHEYYQDNARVFISHNPFNYSPLLTSLCCDKKLTTIINNYFGEKSYIRQGVALRYLPLNRHATCTDQWHHDGTGKAINVMILLTDIGENDQYMTYAEGSHRIRHEYKQFFGKNMFFPSSIDYVKKHLKREPVIVKAKGRAGDIFIFDSNGTHSANRTLGAIRDVFIVVYHTDTSSMWNFTLPIQGLPKGDKYHPFKKNNPEAKQLYPTKADNWRDSLYDTESWLTQ